MTFFCNLKISTLWGSPPHRVIPYLRWGWKHAKYSDLVTYGFVNFCKKFIRLILVDLTAMKKM